MRKKTIALTPHLTHPATLEKKVYLVATQRKVAIFNGMIDQNRTR